MGKEKELVGVERDPQVQKISESRRRVQELELERSEKALKGELPVSPALEQNLEEEDEQLRATLRDRLGPGFETSTPGIEALAEQRQRHEALREEARRGQLSTAEQLSLSRQKASGTRLRDFMAQSSGVASMGGGNATINQILGNQRQRRADKFAFEQGQKKKRASAVGTGAQVGAVAAGSATGGLGAPAGAAVGAGAGLLLNEVF